jgi:hypothetical protein
MLPALAVLPATPPWPSNLTSLPGDCLQAWRAACPGKSNLHSFQRSVGSMVATQLLITYFCWDLRPTPREMGNKGRLRTAHWDVLLLLVAVIFPTRGSD